MSNVSEIHVYPIKSMRGISLQESEMEDRGLRYDRRWALIDATRRIITAREHPGMLKIETRITGGRLFVTAAGASLEIPELPPSADIIRIDMWAKEQHPAMVYPDDVNRWFSERVGLDCSLIFMGEACRREIPEELPSGYRGAPGHVVSYADDFPLLIASEASLRDLNARLDEPIPMQRFRPNLVVSGCEPYEEDSWRLIRIGECELEFAQQCPRCVMTTIDPATAVRNTSQEPLRTLATYRKVPGGVGFGVQLIPRRGGKIRVGDEIEVLR